MILFSLVFFLKILHMYWRDFPEEKNDEKMCKWEGKVFDFSGKPKTLSCGVADLSSEAKTKPNDIRMT